ncbi:hypothetical protein Dsin_000164 [Dipteronia sinensis]|uniref:Flavin-containing monooxygenase n=1 Tax=Dipteronia sinensis TaxID=43782 RepID=A0AAD9Z2N8_9ROSI|nr:hypothetical protein Dsin_000164 [Dipteronia sinensis]
MYLKEFARVFGVEEFVRFEVEVVKVCLMENNKWKVRSKKRGDGDIIVEEAFDAVVVCNGGRNYQPHVADIPGTLSFIIINIINCLILKSGFNALRLYFKTCFIYNAMVENELIVKLILGKIDV